MARSQEFQDEKKSARCAAMITNSATGRRCKRESVTGPDDEPRCEVHIADKRNGFRGQTMSRFYRQTLKGKLGEQVADILEGMPGAELTKLHEELAIAKVAADQIVTPFALAMELPDVAENMGIKVGTAQQVLDVMSQVADLASSAAKIDIARMQLQGSLRSALELIVSRVTRAAYEAFGDDYRVREFTEALQRDLTLPSTLGGNGNELGSGLLLGTKLMPDGTIIDAEALSEDNVTELVGSMDESIPAHGQ